MNECECLSNLIKYALVLIISSLSTCVLLLGWADRSCFAKLLGQTTWGGVSRERNSDGRGGCWESKRKRLNRGDEKVCVWQRGSVSMFFHCELLKGWQMKNAEAISESSLAMSFETWPKLWTKHTNMHRHTHTHAHAHYSFLGCEITGNNCPGLLCFHPVLLSTTWNVVTVSTFF